MSEFSPDMGPMTKGQKSYNKKARNAKKYGGRWLVSVLDHAAMPGRAQGVPQREGGQGAV